MVLKNSKSPLYYQLAEIILSEIENKNLKENDKLLTEREYAKKYELRLLLIWKKKDMFIRFRDVELLYLQR